MSTGPLPLDRSATRPDRSRRYPRDGVGYACLYGTDQDQLDTPEAALRPVLPRQRVIRRVTAFNEMSVLESEQSDGWHLVGVWGWWTYLERPARISGH